MSGSKNTEAAAKAITNAKASLKAPPCKKPQEVLNSLARNSYQKGYVK
jgi:hypothetical protein